jgi:hypothetical protein
MNLKPLTALVFGLLFLTVLSGCISTPERPTGEAVSIKSIDFTPEKPKGLKATSVSGKVMLSWMPPKEKVEFYKIYRSLKKTTGFHQVGELDLRFAQNVSGKARKQVYSFVDPKVTRGVNYCYKIMAQITVNNKNYESTFSEPVCLTV